MITSTIDTKSQDWAILGLCRDEDPELFFRDDIISQMAAKTICQRCPVRAECLDAGMKIVDGIWGGLTVAERRQINTPRIRAKCPSCRGMKIYSEDKTALCCNCGMSWRTAPR
jgi:WhiB family redox-sensing transcriptional regulator